MKKRMTIYGCLFAMLLSLASCGSKISSSEGLVKAISNAESMEQIDNCIESVPFNKRIEYQKEIGKVILNDKDGKDPYTRMACVAYLYIEWKHNCEDVMGKLNVEQVSVFKALEASDGPVRDACSAIVGSNENVLFRKALNYYKSING